MCLNGPFKMAARVIQEGHLPCEMRVSFRLTLSVPGERTHAEHSKVRTQSSSQRLTVSGI